MTARRSTISKPFMFGPLFLMGLVAVCATPAPALATPPSATLPPLTDYVSPCLGGTDAAIFSWHGVNQDGLPPVDLDRRSVDFLCVEKRVFAPHSGVVWGQVENFGGLILIDDPVNESCINLLGMEDIDEDITAGTIVETGDFLGFYRWHIHIAVTEGSCELSNWYNWDSREFERPVAYAELGRVVPSDIFERDAIWFVSQNPTTQIVVQDEE